MHKSGTSFEFQRHVQFAEILWDLSQLGDKFAQTNMGCFLGYLATCNRDSTDWNYQRLGCYNPSPKLIDIPIHPQYYGSNIFKNDLPMESDGSFFQCNMSEELWIEYILDQTLDPHQLLVPLHSYMYTQLYLSLSPSQSIHPYLYIYISIYSILYSIVICWLYSHYIPVVGELPFPHIYYHILPIRMNTINIIYIYVQ